MIRKISLCTGEIIAERYKILSHLGSNAYKIYDLHIGRVLAIKFHAKNEEGISWKRFLREVKIMAHTSHSYVLPIYEFGKTEQYAYYTMPFQKYTLKRFILEFPEDAKKNALHILAKITNAIQHLNTCNIVHRDLKPENILIDKENMIPFVFDFGIAKVIDDLNFDSGIDTQTDAFMGTYFYSAPEQENPKEASEKNDVYSLGCILYELLTGEILFREKSISGIQQKKANPTLKKISRHKKKIIQKCLQHDSRRRISLDDLLKMLNNSSRNSIFWKSKEAFAFFTVALFSFSFQFNIYPYDYNNTHSNRSQQNCTHIHQENNNVIQNNIIAQNEKIENNNEYSDNILDTFVIAQQILKTHEFILRENKKMSLDTIFSDYGREIFQKIPHLIQLTLPTGLAQENNLIFYNTNALQEKYKCILVIGKQNIEFTIYRH